MSTKLDRDEIAALLAENSRSPSEPQSLSCLDGGCSERLQAHLDRFAADPAYARQVVRTDLARMRDLFG